MQNRTVTLLSIRDLESDVGCRWRSGVRPAWNAVESYAMKARLVETRTVAEGTAAFLFQPETPLEFTPGQTCDITLVTPTYHDDEGPSRTFSIASSPADRPRLMIATRLTGTAFKRTLAEAGSGVDVDLDGPFGSFTLHRNPAKPAAFFAGGIGITPFRSIIKDATERQLPHRLTLVYSNRTPGSTAFLSDLETWRRQNPNVRLVLTATDIGPDVPWPYERGVVDADFIRHRVGGLGGAVCYVAGPPGFVTSVRSALETVGVDPDDVRFEEFSGY
jgi:ferredoxin-NADP reductase